MLVNAQHLKLVLVESFLFFPLLVTLVFCATVFRNSDHHNSQVEHTVFCTRFANVRLPIHPTRTQACSAFPRTLPSFYFLASATFVYLAGTRGTTRILVPEQPGDTISLSSPIDLHRILSRILFVRYSFRSRSVVDSFEGYTDTARIVVHQR